MRKYISIILLSLVIFYAIGCSVENSIPKNPPAPEFITPSTQTPLKLSDIEWWQTASGEIRQMLKTTNRTTDDIEQPKWFEVPYSTLGRMPLVDTALANPLLAPEIAMYFDNLCKNSGYKLSKLFSIAEQMADQAVVADDNVNAPFELSSEILSLIKEIQADENIPAKVKEAVIILVEATAKANQLRHKAFEPLKPEETARITQLLPQYFIRNKDGKEEVDAYTVKDIKDCVELIRLIQKVDFEMLLQSARIMASFADEASRILKIEDFSRTIKMDSDIIFEKDTSIGRIMIGNKGDNIYTKDCAIIIDIGGNDIYLNNAGGTRPDGLGASIVIDIKGNDIYRAQDFCQGCGYGGVGILVDFAGNDSYSARYYSQGAALLGFGMLLDEEGDDVYTGDLGMQSFAIFGYSILAEAKGMDIYRCNMMGQGFASTLGVAILAEGEGNDSYHGGGKYGFYKENDSAAVQGAASGMRMWPVEEKFTLYGGVALLSEASGNDKYYAYAFAQGGSYILSLGMMVDSAGDDYYSGTDYVQGSGCHLGAGVLVDRAGNDTYLATNHSTGGSLDRSVGVLLDISGNDIYISPNGIGYAGKPRGVGILVDINGNDTYLRGVIGRARFPYGEYINSSAFFLDLAGYDSYETKEFSNNRERQQEEWGLAKDFEIKPRIQLTPTLWTPVSYSMNKENDAGINSKIIKEALSSHTLVRFKAFGSILDAKENAINLLIEIAGYESPFARNDMIDIIETLRLEKLITKEGQKQLFRIIKVPDKNTRLAALMFFIRAFPDNIMPEADNEMISILSGIISSEKDAEVLGIAALVLGQNGKVDVLPVLEKLLENPDWSVKRRAVMALGYIKDKKAFQILINMLEKESAYQVRTQIAASLGKIMLPEAIPYLKKIINPDGKGTEESEFVLFNASRALARDFKEKDGITNLIKMLKCKNPIIREAIVETLGIICKQSFGGNSQQWEKWWRENQDSFVFNILEKK
jgi:hypothetical protein